MPWDPDQYHRFQSERFAPFADLLALVRPRSNMRVIDLGCGTGELTRRLADRLPGSDVVGLDSSPEMLGRAAPQVRPGLRFELGRLEEVTGKWDLVFSHAVLQWVDDHEALIPRLLALLAPGGQLAVQLPSNHDHPAYRAIGETAGEAPFDEALGGWSRASPVLPIARYAELLHRHGGRDLSVLEKVYPHLLPDADAVAEWTRGTAMVPYFERLPAGLHSRFLQRYCARLRALWPEGPVFYAFRRTLFAATAPES
jgi:trans-aconitate 2-methyltransferase